jgi:hypothetical protein
MPATHEIVPRDEDQPLACWVHGIMRLMESDDSSTHSWYKRMKWGNSNIRNGGRCKVLI